MAWFPDWLQVWLRELAASWAWAGRLRHGWIPLTLTTMGIAALAASDLLPWVQLRSRLPYGYGPVPGPVTVTATVSLNMALATPIRAVEYWSPWMVLLVLAVCAVRGRRPGRGAAVVAVSVAAWLAWQVTSLAARAGAVYEAQLGDQNPFLDRPVDMALQPGLWSASAALVLLVTAAIWRSVRNL